MIAALEEAIKASAKESRIVAVDGKMTDITTLMRKLWAMDLVDDVDCSEENDGSWDVFGETDDGDEFRLRVRF